MKLVEFNWSPTHSQLRQFGAICCVVVLLIGWLGDASDVIVWGLLVASSLLALVSWRKPELLRPLFVTLIAVTAPIGMLVSEIAMLIIYFGIFLPIGTVFRLMHRDALQLKIDQTASTYWQEKVEPESVTSYYRQY